MEKEIKKMNNRNGVTITRSNESNQSHSKMLHNSTLTEAEKKYLANNSINVGQFHKQTNPHKNIEYA